MHHKIAEVKQHVSKNKKVYIAATGGVIVGIVVRGTGPELRQIVGSFNYKSTTNNIVTTELTRRGHPGFKILNNLTGEKAASIRRMAEMDDVSRGFIINNTQGGSPLYTNLGEMT